MIVPRVLPKFCPFYWKSQFVVASWWWRECEGVNVGRSARAQDADE